jgi:ABC-type multidrug transport system fused ATPase/permease subunit
MLNSVRKGIGVVPQDVSLFHVDIMHNMGYGQMDVGEEVKEAAR